MSSIENKLTLEKEAKLLRQQARYETHFEALMNCDNNADLLSATIRHVFAPEDYLTADRAALEQLLADPYPHMALRQQALAYPLLFKKARQVGSKLLGLFGDDAFLNNRDRLAFWNFYRDFLGAGLYGMEGLPKTKEVTQFLTKTSKTSRNGFLDAMRSVRDERRISQETVLMWGEKAHAWTGMDAFFVLAASIHSSRLGDHLEEKKINGYPVRSIVAVHSLMAALYFVITAHARGLARTEPPLDREAYKRVWAAFKVIGEIALEKVTQILSKVTSSNFLLRSESSTDIEQLVLVYYDVMHLCFNDLRDVLWDIYQRWMQFALLLVADA